MIIGLVFCLVSAAHGIAEGDIGRRNGGATWRGPGSEARITGIFRSLPPAPPLRLLKTYDDPTPAYNPIFTFLRGQR